MVDQDIIEHLKALHSILKLMKSKVLGMSQRDSVMILYIKPFDPHIQTFVQRALNKFTMNSFQTDIATENLTGQAFVITNDLVRVNTHAFIDTLISIFFDAVTRFLCSQETAKKFAKPGDVTDYYIRQAVEFINGRPYPCTIVKTWGTRQMNAKKRAKEGKAFVISNIGKKATPWDFWMSRTVEEVENE